MKITYDKNVDAAYIYVSDENATNKIAKTYSCDPLEIKGEINLDFDKDGKLVGIEVLNATAKLPHSILKSFLDQK